LDEQAALGEIARLEAIVGGDPGAPAFPALAEANRRAGRSKEAERVAREGLLHRPDVQAGHVALALALLDQDREDEARHTLERVLEQTPDHPVAGPALPGPALEAAADVSLDAALADEAPEIGDDELDRAFASAEANVESMVSANDLAAQAVRAAELDGPEGIPTHSPFATRTMANLLERQGHGVEAQAIRERAELNPRDSAGTSLPDPQRRRVIGTLERWLDHLRRARR
jgi:tetratricopeptide (TPR) repeat protein